MGNTSSKYEDNLPECSSSNHDPVPSPSFSESSEATRSSSIPSSLSPTYNCSYQQQATTFLNHDMSIQRYHSQFIKEGLTAEDEERRRRRRDRNKVAATKCRNKKKERT